MTLGDWSRPTAVMRRNICPELSGMTQTCSLHVGIPLPGRD